MNNTTSGHQNKVHYRHFYNMSGIVIQVNETTEGDCYEHSRMALQSKSQHSNPLL